MLLIICLTVKTAAGYRRYQNRNRPLILCKVDVVRCKNVFVGVTPLTVSAGIVESAPVKSCLRSKSRILALVGLFVIVTELYEEIVALTDRALQGLVILLRKKAA